MPSRSLFARGFLAMNVGSTPFPGHERGQHAVLGGNLRLPPDIAPASIDVQIEKGVLTIVR